MWETALAFFVLTASSCSSVFYYPDRVLHTRPELFQRLAEVEEIQFLSLDQKTKLNAWHLRPRLKAFNGTIIQFHGNGQNLSSHVAMLAWLVEQGYEVFAWDYRGYGGSEGEPTPKGVIEDGIAALNEIWKRKASTNFIVIGQSLGGAVAIRSVDQFSHKDKISNLILDSTFASYKTVARQTFSGVWWLWPFQWVGWLVASNEGDAREALSRYHGRTLVIHDENDPTVYFESGKQVFELLPGPKTFWPINEGRHLGVFASAERRKKFLAYLNGAELKP